MNGLMPFLYLSNHTVCPYDTVTNFCGYTIMVKSHRQIYTGHTLTSTSEHWGKMITGIGGFRTTGTAVH